MRQTHLFTKTRREAPADEVSKNAQLLIRAGFVHKEMAGAYDYLPLGLRVIDKIRGIIREEMNAIGGQEVSLTALQDPEIWKETDRWDDEKVDVWFKTKLKNDTELGLGCTHEEPMARMMRDHVNSYRDLPRYTYQFQTKFRNELRAKSGIMRGREFLMKDMYSFSRTEEELDAFYEKAIEAYKNVYQRAGIGDKTFLTFASGGMFSKFSHEFQTICDAGEDIIYIDDEKGIAVTMR
jgi:prolyl-tRNA synthetase